jgi:hypothetical protein
MWHFLKDLGWVVVVTLLLLLATWVLPFWMKPNAIVTGYARLSDSSYENLILGTSRAAYAVSPEVLEAQLIGGEWCNFSFTLSDSPWCAAYANAVEDKLSCLDSQTQQPVFLLFVDPWSLSEEASGETSFLADQGIRSCGTSGWYFLLKHTDPLGVWKFSWWNALVDANSSWTGIHRPVIEITPSGWLKAEPINDLKVIRRAIDSKLQVYRGKSRSSSWPGVPNQEALEQVIDAIQSRTLTPKIVLVRPPVVPEFKELEESHCPGFQEEMNRLLSKYNLRYWDFSESSSLGTKDFQDAHHLNSEGARVFSLQLADSLRTLQ